MTDRSILTPHHCEIPGCEYEKFFQRHRIVPGRDGGKYKKGNVIALCPNHHAEADSDLFTQDELLAIVASRIESKESENDVPTDDTGSNREGDH